MKNKIKSFDEFVNESLDVDKQLINAAIGGRVQDVKKLIDAGGRYPYK